MGRGSLLGVLAVLGAAAAWGAIGVSYTLILRHYDVTPLTVVTVRATAAALLLAIPVVLHPALRSSLRRVAEPGTRGALVGLGVISTGAFYVVLIYAYREAGVAVATVLLYLAPTLVAVGSALFFGHRVTARQVVALAVALAGVAGVSGLVSGAGETHLLGIVLGVASAVTYASYSLFGQVALRRLPVPVVTTASLTLGAVILLLVRVAIEGGSLPPAEAVAVIALVNGVGTTIVPLTLYTWALTRLGPPRASLIALTEPVVAVVLARLVLGETLSTLQVAGAVLVLSGLLIGTPLRRKRLREGARPSLEVVSLD